MEALAVEHTVAESFGLHSKVCGSKTIGRSSVVAVLVAEAAVEHDAVVEIVEIDVAARADTVIGLEAGP